MNIGIDTGGTTTRIWDGNGQVEEFSTPYDYFAYIDLITTKLAVKENIECVVIGIPAVVKNNLIIKAPNLSKNWNEKNLASALMRNLDSNVRIKILQDTEVAGYGFKVLNKFNNYPSALLTLSTGVGGSLLTESDIIPLEFGHIILDSSQEAMRCNCGQLGCVETFLSGWSITKRTGVNPSEISEQGFWNDYGVNLAGLLITIIPLFGLKEIHFFGGLTKKFDFFINSTKTQISRFLPSSKIPEIHLSDERNLFGVKGAYFLSTGDIQ